jgi:hypothetical protein
MEIETTKYVCTKCKAEDSDRGVNPPSVLNCYKCKAGMGMDIEKMLRDRVGMFPVSREK